MTGGEKRPERAAGAESMGAGAPPWARNYPRGVPWSYPMPEVTLDRLLDDAAQDFPNGVAVSHRGRGITWRQLQDQADRLAAALAHEGVARGTRLAMVLPRLPQAFTVLFAAWRLGATVLVVDPASSTGDIVELAARWDCRAVVVSDSRRDLPAVPDGATLWMTTGSEDVLPFPGNVAAMLSRRLRPRRRPADRLMDLIHRHAPLSPARPASGRGVADIAALFPVGGRQHSFTHRHLIAAAFQLRLWLPDTLAGAERMLPWMPLHTPAGLTAVVTTPTLAAATAVLPAGDDERQLGRAVTRDDPTIVVTDRAPGAAALSGGKTAALRIYLRAGPGGDREVHRRTGARVRGWWAPPESAGPVLAEPVYGRTVPGTVGIPVTGTHVRIVDGDGTEVPAGQPGRICVAGPQLPDTATRVPGGWLHTATAGVMDAHGYVTLGRPVGDGSGAALPSLG